MAMKRLYQLIAILTLVFLHSTVMWGQRVAIIHTNDTHSQIDPLDNGLGGVARRAALIDSLRRAEPNLILVDVGDAWQGSVFFTIYKGEVEQGIINLLDYDYQLVGNHEFDNGLEMLARQHSKSSAKLLASNYNFDGTPLQGMYEPFAIKEIDGKRIGFIPLNINPIGLIDPANFVGVQYTNQNEAAQALAWYLKNVEKVDKVVVLSHIGYTAINEPGDADIARNSRYIDAIIGGHSHTYIDPNSPKARIKNLDGKDVLVLQTKSKGQYLGELILDFDTDTLSAKLLPVDAHLDAKLDNPTTAKVNKFIEQYRHAVDSISAIVVGKTAYDFPEGSTRLVNLLSDYTKQRGEKLSDAPVDLAIMNVGGIRSGMRQGNVTKGVIMGMLPFDNSVVVMDIKGRDLIANIDSMAALGGQGVSHGVKIEFNPATHKVLSAEINGKPIDPDKTYRLATISYLAQGGDRMTPLRNGTIIARSKNILFQDLIDDFEKGGLWHKKKIKPDDDARMLTVDK